MEKPKMLPPFLRPKKRYIAFSVISDSKVPYGELSSAVWNCSLGFLGEMNSAEANFRLIENLYDETNGIGIIVCNHDSVEEVRVVLSMLQTIAESRAIIKILGVTGTIKSAKTKYLGIKDLRNYRA
ncbi:MAG: Rpp14/Pop5 family protein [Candidatus Aenigmatarchaeota archaeon]